MTFEEKYKEYIENIHPGDALLEETKRKMLHEMRPEEAAPARSAKTVVRKKSKNRQKWVAYAGVAVAASLLTAIVLTGANRIMNRTSADKAAPAAMYASESAVLSAAAAEEEETNELEYQDITIYYEQNGRIAEEAQYMECSVEKIVDVWAMLNDIHDLKVNVVEFMDEGNAVACHLDLSETVKEQLDDKGIKLQALSMTLTEYLNADSVTITAEGELLG